jgi:hypothetical protein
VVALVFVRASGLEEDVWGAQIRFRLGVQACVNAVDFAHPPRGLGALDDEAADLIFARARQPS